MKRILLTAAIIIAAAFTVKAQSIPEICARMTEELSKGETMGQAFDMIMTLPIIGKIGGRTWINGDNFRMEAIGKDDADITWRTPDTEWNYNPTENTVTIKKVEKKAESENNNGQTKNFESISQDYDLKIVKEDDDAWYMTGKKAKTNTNKDDPKTIKMAVSKQTYLPLYYTARQKGVTISMENFQVGVTPEEVTFDPAKYPGVKIIDQR